MLRETMTRTMPVAMIAMPAAWTAIVIMLVGWMSVPPLRMLNVTQDEDEGDEHAEQPEVDLRLREKATYRGASGWLGLGLTMGPVLHRPRSPRQPSLTRG